MTYRSIAAWMTLLVACSSGNAPGSGGGDGSFRDGGPGGFDPDNFGSGPDGGAADGGGSADTLSDGAVPDGTTIACGEGATLAPRLLSPISTGRVTTRRPTLRWEPVPDGGPTSVDLCRDRACRDVIATLDADGTSIQPDTDLPPGVVFWRARVSEEGELAPCRASATWEMVVPPRDTGGDTSWGTFLDVNGDGFGDVLTRNFELFSGTGSFYVYLGSEAGLEPEPALTLGYDGVDPAARQLVSAGDVNGDGFADVAVGHPGTIHIHLGSADGLLNAPATILFAPPEIEAGPGFGDAIASAGDVDGDGYGDLVVGWWSPEYTGRAYVYYGSAEGLADVPGQRLNGAEYRILPPEFGDFGSTVAGAGDVNGDGFSDIIVSALRYPRVDVDGPCDDGGGRDGSGDHGGGGGIDIPPGTPACSECDPDENTQTLCVEGGSACYCFRQGGEVMVTCPEPPVVSCTRFGGAAYVFLGGPGGIGIVPSSTLEAPGLESTFGFPAMTAGDFNGDGRTDVAIPGPTEVVTHDVDPEAGTGRFVMGAVYVYYGEATGMPTEPSLRLTPSTEGITADYAQLELRSIVALDANGDGFADLAVSESHCLASDCSTGEEHVALYMGGPAGLPEAPAHVVTGADPLWSGFGALLATSDTDGDARAELVVAAPCAPFLGFDDETRAMRCGGGQLQVFPGTDPVMGEPAMTLSDGGGERLGYGGLGSSVGGAAGGL